MIELDKQHYQQQFTKAQQALAATNIPWLQQLRQQAINDLLNFGLPNTRMEDWKYTNLKPVAKKSFAMISSEHIDFISKQIPRDQLNVIFINGQLIADLSTKTLPKGISITSIKSAFQTQADLLEPLLKEAHHQTIANVTLLNTALFTDGIFINVAPKQVIKPAIHIYHFNSNNDAPSMSHLRHIIMAAEHSAATIIEHHSSIDDSVYLATTTTKLMCQAGAQLNHYKVQQESPNAYHISSITAELQRDSQLALFNLDLGGRLVRTDSHAQLMAPGAHCDLSGLYMPTGKQHVDNHTCIDHQQAHTSSNEFYKGILDGRAKAVFNGKVVVQKDAQKISADQTNKNLLLSTKAEVDTKPQLEIYADDVKCSHGATVGQLDPTALFYLQSRGIEEHIARNALIFGFAKDALEKIKDDDLKLQLEKIIMDKFNETDALRELL